MTDFGSGIMYGALAGVSSSSLIQPDTVTGVQWQAMFARKALSPEERLCEALMESALHDLRLGDATIARPTVTWIEAADGPFPAFSAVCDALGLEPSCLRKGLLAIYHGRTWGKAEGLRRPMRRRVTRYATNFIGGR